MFLVEVIAVRRDEETKTVERVDLLIDGRYQLAFVRHLSKPRTLLKVAVVDLAGSRSERVVSIPEPLWKAALRKAYAIFFPTRKRISHK